MPIQTPKSWLKQDNILNTPGKNCVLFAKMMSCILVLIYKSHSFIAFHESFVNCLLIDVLILKISPMSAASQTVIPRSLFCEVHIKQKVSSRSVLIPHFTLLPLAFDLTKGCFVLTHLPYRPHCHQPNISSWLIHVQTVVSYCYTRMELLQCCSVLRSVV